MSVELALVAPLLMTLMFGIVEFGMMFHCQMQLNNMTREATRIAAIGAQPTAVSTRLAASGTLHADTMTVTMDYRTYLGSGTWSAWTALVAGTDSNTAPTGAEVRVQTVYPYRLVVGSMFAFLVDQPTTRTETLRGSTIMRRE